MTTMTTAQTVRHMQSMFARHGFPETLVSDNGPQFSSAEFAAFATKHKIHHVTSSPLYPQANAMAERAVQTVKRLLRSSGPYDALLAYRTTPLENGYSGRLTSGKGYPARAQCVRPVIRSDLL